MPNRTINIPCVGATLPLPPAVPALCFLGLMALLLAAVAAGRVKGYWLGCPRSLYFIPARAPRWLRHCCAEARWTLGEHSVLATRLSVVTPRFSALTTSSYGASPRWLRVYYALAPRSIRARSYRVATATYHELLFFLIFPPRAHRVTPRTQTQRGIANAFVPRCLNRQCDRAFTHARTLAWRTCCRLLVLRWPVWQLAIMQLPPLLLLKLTLQDIT